MARIGLSKHRKFRVLARAIGSPAMARGSLELLWDAGHETLDPVMGMAEDVEEVTYWKGKKGVLAKALVAAGFLDVAEDGTLSIHGFWEHAPSYVKKRAGRRNSGAKQVPHKDSIQPPDGSRTAAEREPNGGQTAAHDSTGHDSTGHDERSPTPSGDGAEQQTEAAAIWRDAAERIGDVRLTLGIAPVELHMLGEILANYSLDDVRVAAEHYWRSKRRLKTVAFFRKDFEAELAAARADTNSEGPRVTLWECPKCGEEHEGPRKLYLAKWCPHERVEVVA